MDLDDKYNKLGESETPWVSDEVSKIISTIAPEAAATAESDKIGTIVIFVISAILTITLLFAIAIFIDCRQEKLTKLDQQTKRPKRRLRIRLPRMGRPTLIAEDEDTFADKMHVPEPSTSSEPSNVIIV